MKKTVFLIAMVIAALAVSLPKPSEGAFTVYEKDGNSLKFGASLQMQYHNVDPKVGQTMDEVFLRRLELETEAEFGNKWGAKLVVDFGKASGDNELAVKEAYVVYGGFKNVEIIIGNANFPFSREVNTSSKRQQFVERTFPGDHDYGAPERNFGVHGKMILLDGKIGVAASIANAVVDPDNKKLDFDSPVVKEADFNEGAMIGGRVDYHPFGELKLGQGDFDGKLKATVGIAAFTWRNDGDNNTYTNAVTKASTSASKFDVDSVKAFEVSGAFRYKGISIDAEYNRFKAETVAESLNTGGMFLNGKTTLKNHMVKGGYMVIKERLELVAGLEAQDADNYVKKWKRTSYGANYFFNNHKTKIQLTIVNNKDVNGVDGADQKDVYVQAQYAF